MADRMVRHWYRATCFGSPIAPWRDTQREARRDLIEQKLGGFDEWGCFFTTVPGGLLTDSAWVDFDEALYARRSLNRAVAMPARARDRQLKSRSRLRS